MKNKKNIYSKFALLLGFIFSFTASCERENSDEVELATFPINPEVFIDGFSSGLEYLPFNGSKLDAFTVDQETKYEGSASMRFDIPNVGDPEGAFAGAIFPDNTGRDLSGFNALTFWAKATQAGTINEIGFGNDFGENKYLATVQNLQLSTNWKKYIIPIPDASKLTQEKGMFWYAEGPEDDKGYTFWIDELQYENLGTIAHPKPAILNGSEEIQQTFEGSKINLSGLTQTFNLASGGNVTVNLAPSYFEFSSSNSNVATVNELGEVSIVGTGSAAITASIAGVAALGSLTLESLGDFTSAPEPTRDPNDVISIFSDTYTNVPVDFYNGFYAPFQTTTSNDFEVNGDAVLNYENYNFVGIEFNQNVPTIDGSEMTNMHVDIFIPSDFDPEATIKITLVDFGADGAFDGGDDSSVSTIISPTSTPALVSGEWISVDFDITGITNKGNLGQIVFSAEGDTSPRPSNFYVDNIYLHKGGGEITPAATLPIDFEDGNNLTGAFDGGANGANADNPDQSGINTSAKVYQFNKVAGAAWYSGMFHIFDQDLDLSQGTAFTFKIWSPNADINVRIQLEKEGGEGTPPTYQIDQTLSQANTWVEMTFDFSDTALNAMDGYDKIVIFPDYDESNQVPVATEAVYYIDDISQDSGVGTAMAPTDAALIPTRAEADVISVYSDAYTDVSGTDFNPNWGQATVVTEESIAGDNVQLYTGLNYQGIVLGSSQDVSGMEFLHLDYWTANSTALNTFLISSGPVETGNALTVPTGGGWTSVDIPLGDFSPVDLADVIQLKFDGDGDVYLDNIYFYKEAGAATAPISAAPTPTQAEADVISVYSDAYTDVSGTDFNPNWGQATVVTEESIAGDNVQLYTGLNYQGIVLGSSQDVSGMEFLHLDYWTANSTALNTFLISSGPVETGNALTVPTGGGWTSVDIPLGDFSPVDLADVIQLKFDGDGDVYLDNIYFYKEPTPAAEPSLPLGFENGETLIPFDNGATAANIDNPDTNGNSSMKVLEFNKVVGSAWYSGVVFDETLRTTPIIDLADGTIFTIKIWSPNAGIQVRFQLEGGAAPAYEVFQTVNTANEWVTLTFDFTSQVNATDTYPKFSVFPDFDAANQVDVTVGAIYYIDDITQQ